MPNAYISGTGMYVPPNVVTNDDLRTKYGIDTTHEWIVQRTGIEARRFSEAGVCSADLAVEASKDAIRNAGIQKEDLDLIVFCTLSPKHAFPGDGVLLQQKLGLCDAGRFIGAMDIRNQCSGFLYGLAAGSSMVQSGMVKHVLVVGAEVHSAALEMSTKGRQIASLFGDGAGAVVLSPTTENRGIRGWYLGADGRHADVLAQRVWDMSKRPYLNIRPEDGVAEIEPSMVWANMDGKLVFKNAVERMVQSFMQACWDQKISLSDIDLFLFHQANMRINQMVANLLGIPDDKLIHNIQKFGNTTAATIPLLMAEAVETGRLKPGMKVACVAFGSGFTWASAIIDW